MASRQLTANLTAHLTPAQKAAAQEAIKRAGYGSDNEALTALLADLCQRQGVPFPSVEMPTEGRNWKRGKGGKFTEKP